jgi:hypothetical protein
MSAKWIRDNGRMYAASRKQMLDGGSIQFGKGAKAHEKLFAVPLTADRQLRSGFIYTVRLKIAATTDNGVNNLFVGVSDKRNVVGFMRHGDESLVIGRPMYAAEFGNAAQDTGKVQFVSPGKEKDAAVESGGPPTQQADILLEEESAEPTVAALRAVAEPKAEDNNGHGSVAEVVPGSDTSEADPADGEVVGKARPGEGKVTPHFFEVFVRIDPRTGTEVLAQVHGNRLPVMETVPVKLHPSNGLSIVAIGGRPKAMFGIWLIEALVTEETPFEGRA